MAEIREGAANACIPPPRIRLRHPYDKLANLGHDPGPSGLFPPLAVVPLPRNQPSVPSQKGFRCDDTGDFCQEFPAKRLTLYREPTSLVVCETKLPPAKPSFEDFVLLEQVDHSRDLSGEDVVAMVLDGKTFADATMVVALGITLSGDKRFLGFVETDTENERVLRSFLRSLVERGLDISEGLLVVIDGSKGLRGAVTKAFRRRVVVGRCQWHKRENVVSYLSKSEQSLWRKRLQRAYGRPTHKEALEAPRATPPRAGREESVCGL